MKLKENELLLHDIEVISAQFWNGIQNSLVGATRREYAKIFFSHLEQLIGNYSEEKYYILPAGIKYNGKSTLTPFLIVIIGSYWARITLKKKDRQIEENIKRILCIHIYIYCRTKC
ncbi:hypothetical protein BsIDN1_68940 [Bacillus safensis]|uniref:Uncharacterized protein n=1 Tax=Bacillus safensis TaxID=561879 RepID=A0A5S9MNF9_BACIA|nr:hypothetical protein BsIDN1_68940 [Bacillus safensis]